MWRVLCRLVGGRVGSRDTRSSIGLPLGLRSGCRVGVRLVSLSSLDLRGVGSSEDVGCSGGGGGGGGGGGRGGELSSSSSPSDSSISLESDRVAESNTSDAGPDSPCTRQ